MSEAAERLEAVAEEAELEKGNVVSLMQEMEMRTSGHQGGAGGETTSLELSIYKTAREVSVLRLHHSSPVPLHPATIKLESGYSTYQSPKTLPLIHPL